jgi:hypothetical protein
MTSEEAEMCGSWACIPNNLAVNSAGDAVLELQVHLGDRVLGEDGGIGDITCRSKEGILVDCSSRGVDCECAG